MTLHFVGPSTYTCTFSRTSLQPTKQCTGPQPTELKPRTALGKIALLRARLARAFPPRFSSLLFPAPSTALFSQTAPPFLSQSPLRLPKSSAAKITQRLLQLQTAPTHSELHYALQLSPPLPSLRFLKASPTLSLPPSFSVVLPSYIKNAKKRVKWDVVR